MDCLLEVTLAGLTLPCALRFPEAAVFPPPDPAAPRVGIEPVHLSEEDWTYYVGQGMEQTPQAEYSLLTAPFSDALMDFDRLILHAVALRWRDRAWLICGPSGVGKSTQARWLQALRPGEFGVICGDRPILEFRHCEPVTDVTGAAIRTPVPPVGAELEESRMYAHIGPPAPPVPVGRPDPRPPSSAILVHPSPWNGKENWHLEPLSARDASLQVFAQVIQTAVREDRILRSAAYVTQLLRTVPLWQLTTLQPPASTRLLLDAVFSP